MSLFAGQPIYCVNCGAPWVGDPKTRWCSPECFRALEIKRTKYIMGRESTVMDRHYEGWVEDWRRKGLEVP